MEVLKWKNLPPRSGHGHIAGSNPQQNDVTTFGKVTYANLQEYIGKKKLILFGASTVCAHCLNRINGLIHVAYICDNDVTKHGGRFFGIEIKAPDVLKSENKEDVVVIISSSFYKEIVPQLLEKGIFNILTHSSLDEMNHLTPPVRTTNELPNIVGVGLGPLEDFRINIYDRELLYKLTELFEIIAEEGDSKKFLQHIIKNRISCDKSDLDSGYLNRRKYGPYFSTEVFQNQKDNEIIVDGGLYNGDNFRLFYNLFGNRLKRVYGFEPGKREFELVKTDLKYMEVLDNNGFELKNINEIIDIKVYPYALSDKNETLYFSSCVTSDKSDFGYPVEAKKIDEIVDPSDEITLIKLDIEGAEISALRGAARTIATYKPRLMICLYHYPCDLWEIPLYIKTLCPDYKFYLNPHYGNINALELHATI